VPPSDYLALAIMVIGALLILASRKKRPGLDTPLISVNALFVMVFSLAFGGVCILTIVYLKS
jgi:hypothetical protein